MADSGSALFDRFKPIWEAVDKLGFGDTDIDMQAIMDETGETNFDVGFEKSNLTQHCDRPAFDPEAQLKMISVELPPENRTLT
ncbi:hypothetical protein SAMN04488118_105319 [Epibacterium ulvae]|uniref:Uncharacterized protein n=1 Tax=Epibacterium ulvae TaxID=1156985 RepID=A0A1G5QU78_9RHOB|nr:hypothetical protein [Epibacterium ulvae]SCZ64781.1 hypothetical protein SAMN04488118_105319 [Epibacterium ulvae]